MKVATKLTIFTPTFLIILFLDQYSKIFAIDNLKGSLPQNYLGGLFRLIYAENKGAWGSLGASWGYPWREIILIYVPLLVLVGLIIYLLFSWNNTKMELIAYSLIATGGISNLIDRMRFNYVVDFLYIGWKSLGTNIFNIADMAIMTGFFILVYYQYVKYKLDHKK